MADQPKKKAFNQKNRNDERPNGKAAKRNGSRVRGTNLNEVQKVLLGGGLYRNTNVTTKSADPWRGLDGVPSPWDPVQAKENRRLYPHLFTRN